MKRTIPKMLSRSVRKQVANTQSEKMSYHAAQLADGHLALGLSWEQGSKGESELAAGDLGSWELGADVLVRMVRLLHCSSTPPCFFPDSVKGVSKTKRLMLWCISKSVLRSSASFSSKKGVT